MFKCLIESDLECSLFSTYFCPQTLFASYFPVSVLASMHHVQSVLELLVLGLGSV